MKKIIKKLGNSYVVTFNQQDREIYDLKEGDYIEFELVKLNSNRVII